jgi:hypothetical protein
MTDTTNTTEKQNLLFKQQQKPYCYLVMLKYNRVNHFIKSLSKAKEYINSVDDVATLKPIYSLKDLNGVIE